MSNLGLVNKRRMLVHLHVFHTKPDSFVSSAKLDKISCVCLCFYLWLEIHVFLHDKLLFSKRAGSKNL